MRRKRFNQLVMELSVLADRPLADHLTVAGWLLLGGSLGLIAFQLDRFRQVGADSGPFGVWDQRIEVLSFVMLPPNLVVLAPAAVVAVAATWLAGPARSGWLTVLLRVIAGIAITMVVIGAVSILNILVNDDTNQFESAFLRLGGMSMAAGIAWLCRAADLATDE